MHSAANSFSREITRHFDSYFEKHDLATSYVELILILHNSQELAQNDLAEDMNLAPSTITRFINKLVKKNLVQKKKSGRTAVVSLSPKGLNLAPKLKENFDKAMLDLEEILSDKYVHTTKELLLHGANLLKEREDE